MGFNGVENLGERGWLGDFTAKDEKKMGNKWEHMGFHPDFPRVSRCSTIKHV